MSGGCFLLDIATQTTRMPTQTTIMVALTGTMILRSIHSGSPGKLDLVSALFTVPPKGGASVPGKREIVTFSNVVVATLEHADDNDGNDDDGKGGHHWHDQVEVGQESHELRLEVCGAGWTGVATKLSSRGQGAYTQQMLMTLVRKIGQINNGIVRKMRRAQNFISTCCRVVRPRQQSQADQCHHCHCFSTSFSDY